jgi:5'-nucleotidase
VAALVSQAESAVAPLVNQVIGTTTLALTRNQSDAGESALGNLLADAQRAAMSSDFAFMNPGGIRADLDAGPVTWGELFTIQPFGNTLIKLTLTGAQVRALLEQQWSATATRFLQISGLSYTWDNALPLGSRVTEVRKGGVALDPAASYTVTANNFIAAGGDGFTVLSQGTGNVGGPVDLDALIAHVEGLTQPFTAVIEGRITRLH